MSKAKDEIFTPEQKDKLRLLSAYLDEDDAMENLLCVSSKFITDRLPMTVNMDEVLAPTSRVSVSSTFKSLSHVFVALYLLGQLLLRKKHWTKPLEIVRRENSREINRLLNAFKTGD